MWWSTKVIKVGLAASLAFCATVLPVPDGQTVKFPPQVITASAANVKVKPQNELRAFAAQPTVYCGVIAC